MQNCAELVSVFGHQSPYLAECILDLEGHVWSAEM